MTRFRTYTETRGDGYHWFRVYVVDTAEEARQRCVADTGKEPILVTDDLNIYPGLK